MLKIYSNPTPKAAAVDLTNSINQIVWRLERLLPKHGIQLVNEHTDAGLFVCHAGIGDGHRADVAHISGLYPTHHFPQHEWHWDANTHVIENVRRAQVVTVPSRWVADLFARDMHLQTKVVSWGVDTDEWQPLKDRNQRPYVLWNKTRVDGICDPTPMNQLAKIVPKMQFISTFGEPDHNVHLTGRLLYNQMAEYVQHAAVYLATTLETFGIGTLEAMSCGVPVLGFDWGGTGEIVKHGITGYLVKPGDIGGLQRGLEYCMEHWHQLGENAREDAKRYTWQDCAANLAHIYHEVHEKNSKPVSPKVSVIIPVHNYARFVKAALVSVLVQKTNFDFEVIAVDDASEDGSQKVLTDVMGGVVMDENSRFTITLLFNDSNTGVAETRNRGIREAKSKYILCLDADDMLADGKVLQTLADALDKMPELGIVYGSLRMMDEQGNASPYLSAWPGLHNFDEQLQRHNQVPTCCMFRRVAWTRTGGYRKRFTPAEDANLWTHIGAIGFRAAKVTEEAMFLYRLHGDSLSSDARTGKRPEPDWLADMPWAQNIRVGRPFASDGRPGRGSWAVRNYCLPAVSIVIPVAKHHLNLLQEAIDSVEAQTYPFWELIIALDMEGIDGYEDKQVAEIMLAAPFARYITTGDTKGAGYARNLGVRHSTAPLLTFLDADDRLHPEFLEKTLKEYRRTGKYIYTDWRSQNKQGVYEDNLCPDYTPGLVFQRTSIHSVSILIEREKFDQVGGFDEGMPAWEDVDLPMKLAVAGICGSRVPIPLLLYRYMTGKRREFGETVKQELIDLLHTRYADYIEGKTMCMCNPPLGIHMPPSFGFTVDSNEPDTSLETVRIRYDGGHGAHDVIGAATQQNYRQHQNGDFFVVYKADLMAQPHLFIVEAELPVLTQQTPMPEPPPVMALNAV